MKKTAKHGNTVVSLNSTKSGLGLDSSGGAGVFTGYFDGHMKTSNAKADAMVLKPSDKLARDAHLSLELLAVVILMTHCSIVLG